MSAGVLDARPFKQFGHVRTIDGFDVIDEATGHTIDHRPTAREAAGVAWHLNECAAFGNLSGALGAGSLRDVRRAA